MMYLQPLIKDHEAQTWAKLFIKEFNYDSSLDDEDLHYLSHNLDRSDMLYLAKELELCS